ncbi:hypothetical protein GCM10009563_16790 [Subtercola frigoramans]
MRPLAIRRVARASQVDQRLVTRSAATTPRSTVGSPARTITETHWRWASVDSRPGFEQIRWGSVDDPHALLEVPLDGSAGILSTDPIFCVCTHAKHDQCCAVRGRPVALALSAEYPEATWECSHLGGDRFAGTMVVFPEGLYFGRADDVASTLIVRDYLDGRVDEAHFRGRSSLSHPVQAAQHYARRRLGDDRLASFRPIAETAVPGARPGVFAVTLAAPAPALVPDHGASYSQAPSDSVVHVVVAETLSVPLLSTCAATRFGRVREFELLSIEVTPM